MQATNNFQQVALTVLGYEQDHAAFPSPAIFDKQGQPLLSSRATAAGTWTVKSLARRSTWTSPGTASTIGRWPATRPGTTAIPKATPRQAWPQSGRLRQGAHVRGHERPQTERDQRRRVQHDRCGRPTTTRVPWTKPEDWKCDPNDPLAGLGDAHPGGFCAAFADGSVKFIPKSVDPKAFYGMLTIAGGENVDPPK